MAGARRRQSDSANSVCIVNGRPSVGLHIYLDLVVYRPTTEGAMQVHCLCVFYLHADRISGPDRRPECQSGYSCSDEVGHDDTARTSLISAGSVGNTDFQHCS